MPRESQSAGRQPAQLEEVILAYLEAADAGKAPAPAEVLARHPELADELRLFFADQARLDPVLAPLRELAPRQAPGNPKVRTIGDYEILKEIGRTGMSVVYKARQVSLNRLVALKMIAPERAPDTKLRARFRAEAQAVAQFDHPNIVRVYEAGEWAGRPYYALELIPGGSLAESRKRKSWTPHAAAGLVAQLANAVAYAHQKGIIHRDLKPANILLAAEGVPKIADFGLSKQFQTDAAALTQTGDCLGTPAYMAPEQAEAKPDAVGPWTDIFGLGAILYDLLTGRAPFAGSTVPEVLAQARVGRVVPPRQLNRRVPAALERICLRALAADPRERYASAAALGEDLRRYLHRPRRLAIAAATAAGLLLAAVGWLAFVFSPHGGGRSAPLALLGTPSAPSSPAPAELAHKARTILQTHCYRCHGQDGSVEGSFNFVLDHEQLVSRRKMVVPGDPDRSRLFKRVRSREMPPENEGGPLREDDITSLREWIVAGAPPFTPSSPPDRPFLNAAALLQSIRDDLETLPPRDRGFLRDFSITHLYNAGIAEDQLQTYRHGLSKLVNSFSWDPEIVVPHPIDPARTIFRIDLRHYRWNSGTWRQVLDQYPYGILHESGTARAIREATGCDVPFVRADWFVFAASRPPLYHDMVQLPLTDRELERDLNLNVATNIRDERVARAGFIRSGVSQNNRMIERHKTGYGAYWKSYDFADNRDQRNLFEHPLGPGSSPNAFQHDGGEIIFNLPNGLQAYLLVNAQGQRLDRGPIQIVKDPRQGDGTVVNGISCMSCHVKGMIEKADEVREHVQKNLAAFATEVEPALALYPPREKFTELLNKDAERFAAAVKQTGVSLGNTDPIVALAFRFEWELDSKLVAAEVDLPTADFLRKLEAAPPALARVFGPLKVKGGTMKRQVMETEFAQLVFNISGEKVLPPRQGPSPGVEIVNVLGMRLRLIPAGKFTMGSPPGEKGRRDDERLHEVEISRPFFMGVHQVTQEEYAKVMGSNPSAFSASGASREPVRGRDTKRFPVERVSWEDAATFCERLSNLPEEKRTRRIYRLPTEAEWEYACRAGSASPFHTGNPLTHEHANFGGKTPTAVGSYPANAFGLRDMHGNVWQWCSDWYDPNSYAKSPPRDPAGPGSGTFRVLRGGSWQESEKDCRSAVRHHSLPGYQNHAYGFRVVLIRRDEE